MTITLYGSALAGTLVHLILLELHLPFTHVPIDIYNNEQHSKDYVTNFHPFAKVPVLQDGDWRMYESRAICRYLVQKYGKDTKLMPSLEGDFKAYALFEQMCSVEQSYFGYATGMLGWEVVIRPRQGNEIDTARVEEVEKELKRVFEVYEGILKERKYLAGEEVTLVDLFHLPNGTAVQSFEKYKEMIEKYPSVDRWFKELQSRPTWIKASAVE